MIGRTSNVAPSPALLERISAGIRIRPLLLPHSMLPWPAHEWVAIVDDDESVRRSLARFCCVSGIRALAFGSAEEFLSHEGTPPSCLVLDVQLGASTAFELRDALAAREGNLPSIVFITARDDVAALGLSNESGVSAWLGKPFPPQALLALLEEMRTSGRAWASLSSNAKKQSGETCGAGGD